MLRAEDRMPDEHQQRRYRGRFAPSPTGELHLGSAETALVAWLSARTRNGTFIVRVEDIDTPRVVPGMESHHLEDLRWLGLDWDEGPDVGGRYGPYRQSERHSLYEEAIEELARQGLVYYCDCSRSEIAKIASAPHPGEEGPRYPGICRGHGLRNRRFKRPPAIRFRVPENAKVTIEDGLQGVYEQDVAATVGDFVLRRGDGVFAYQLAVVVDDHAMGVTEIVRGFDLLSSAPRQALLARLLDGKTIAFAHTPLVLDPSGKRLAKRDASLALRFHRESKTPPERVVAKIARWLGLVGDEVEAITPQELCRHFDRRRLRGQASVRIEGG